MVMVTLRSSDGKKFEIDRDIVNYIGMINDMVQNFDDEQLENEPIKLQVDSIMLDKVLKWAAYRKSMGQSTEKDLTFESDFINENGDYLYELINIANFLDFADMMRSLCQSVAMRMKGKTSEELRREFSINEP